MIEPAQMEIAEQPTTKQLWQAVYRGSLPFGFLSFVLLISGKESGASAFGMGGFFFAFSLIPVIVHPFYL
jgi:hypothetical protein